MIALALLTALCPALHAESPPALPGQGTNLSAGGELAAASRYVWRGMPVGGGPTLQPSAWLGVENVTLSAWGNINLDEADGTGLNEVDLLLSFEQQWESLSFTPSLVAYLFPGAGFTAEATGDFTWQPSWVGLYSNHALDFWDARPGWWSETGVSFSMGLPANLGLDLNLGASFANGPYNTYYLGLDRFGMQYGCAGAGLGWAHASGLYAALSGRLDLLPGGEVQDALGGDAVLAHALLSVGWGGSAVWVR
jgi:hypothetical protein